METMPSLLRRTSLFLIAFLSLAAWVGSDSAYAAKGADVVLEVTPIIVKEFEIGDVVDVIEGNPDRAELSLWTVQFRIEDELRGKFTRVEIGGASKLDQAVEAAEGKDLFKILTLDFQDPKEKILKPWLTVAVVDPYKTFGLKPGSDFSDEKYKIYLKKDEANPQAFYLLEAKKIR